MRPLIARLLALFRRRQLDDELSDEMSTHLKLSTADYVDRGMSLADARRAAGLRFGGTLQTAEAYRDRQGFPLLESLWQDMRGQDAPQDAAVRRDGRSDHGVTFAR